MYWEADWNCARTILHILAGQNQIKIADQTDHATIGLHGAGGFQAQCGLVEGALMFIGIYGKLINDSYYLLIYYNYYLIGREMNESWKCLGKRRFKEQQRQLTMGGLKMDRDALFQITYGLYVLGVKQGKSFGGCIINTAVPADGSNTKALLNNY